MAGKKKDRLDKLLVAKKLAPTRAKAQALIMAGEVRVNGEPAQKAGMSVAFDAEIEVAEPLPYVSRGGYKLAGALEEFDIDLTGATCADVGACTGGFSDVMLQQGAARIYAIDVGYGQLAWKIRQNPKVEVLERTNARYLDSLPEPINFVSIDVSFISLRLILPAVKKWLADQYNIVALIKPQFEAGRKQVGKGGIVKDPDVHRQVLEEILTWCVENELYPANLSTSSITGTDGNVEFLVWLQENPDKQENLESLISKLVPTAPQAD
jgi:23S rRNA (cytidine1920-2'-O)/16S rRNA (cytidine1409-2'-O)-methyltransferase